jgi:hypothetical protein
MSELSVSPMTCNPADVFRKPEGKWPWADSSQRQPASTSNLTAYQSLNEVLSTVNTNAPGLEPHPSNASVMFPPMIHVSPPEYQSSSGNFSNPSHPSVSSIISPTMIHGPCTQEKLVSAVENSSTDISRFPPTSQGFVRGQRLRARYNGSTPSSARLGVLASEHLKKCERFESELISYAIPEPTQPYDQNPSMGSLPQGLHPYAQKLREAYRRRVSGTSPVDSQAMSKVREDMRKLCRNTVYGVAWGQWANDPSIVSAQSLVNSQCGQ